MNLYQNRFRRQSQRSPNLSQIGWSRRVRCTELSECNLLATRVSRRRKGCRGQSEIRETTRFWSSAPCGVRVGGSSQWLSSQHSRYHWILTVDGVLYPNSSLVVKSPALGVDTHSLSDDQKLRRWRMQNCCRGTSRSQAVKLEAILDRGRVLNSLG
jgi:hypothetical protein